MANAEQLIQQLPKGFETYLDRPVKDYYSSLPDGTITLFGRRVDHGKLRRAGKMRVVETSSLSGGQLQRLAL